MLIFFLRCQQKNSFSRLSHRRLFFVTPFSPFKRDRNGSGRQAGRIGNAGRTSKRKKSRVKRKASERGKEEAACMHNLKDLFDAILKSKHKNHLLDVSSPYSRDMLYGVTRNTLCCICCSVFPCIRTFKRNSV